MPAVSVVVPCSLDAERARLWAHLRPRWEALGFEVVEGTCPDDGPWRKGVAVADAAARSSGDVLIVADADVWCDGIGRAVAQVQDGRSWAVPHERVLRLNERATDRVLAGQGWPCPVPGFLAQDPYKGFLGGGIVVLTRDAWRAAPIDPRFAGWGQEDESWSRALLTLGDAAWRGRADLWHLWHGEPVRKTRGIGSDESLALFSRYADATGDPEAMRALIDEARQEAVANG